MASASNFLTKDKGVFSRPIYAFVPKTAVVPLSHVAESADELEVLVQAGEAVQEGQLLARMGQEHIHASIPGIVERIENCEYPDGMQGKAAFISLKGEFSYTGKHLEEKDWRKKSPQELCEAFSTFGVVNTFAESEPLGYQIQTLHENCARLLILRLFDDDPSRAVEDFLTTYELPHIIEGVSIIAKAMGAQGVVVVAAKKANQPLDAFNVDGIPVTVVRVDATRYPTGSKRDLTLAIKKQCKDAPWSQVTDWDLCIDVQTACNARETVVYEHPVTEQYVHVTGKCLNATAILRVKIGTTLAELAEHCGGFRQQLARIIVNGIVTGDAVTSLQIPVTKTVKSVEFQTASQVKNCESELCIRCGMCHEICPVNLFPDRMYRAFVHGDFAADRERQAALTANLCTHCGLCNAVCPSRLPLCQIMPLL